MKPKTPAQLGIDPDALYTIEQTAQFLMKMEPGMTFMQARQCIEDAIASGRLKTAGKLVQ